MTAISPAHRALPAHRTILEAVDAQARLGPHRTALQYPAQGRKMSFAELVRAASGWTAVLHRAGVEPGDLVGVVLPNDDRFIPVVLGAWRLGAAVAPMPVHGSFAERDSYLDHVAAMLDSGHIGHVVCDVEQPLIDELGRRLNRLVSWIPVGRETPPAPDTVSSPEIAEDALALVQYTSGSTSAPKGVELTHANILAGLTSIRLAAAVDDRDAIGLWIPLFHDMGLFSVLTLLMAGGGASIWPPSTFLRRPARWLAEFAQLRLTLYSGPNFSFDLMADSQESGRQDLDLSAWRVAFNGAEPVNHATIDRFVKVFSDCGLSPTTMFPVYGLAEAVLAVAFPPVGRPPRVAWVGRETLSRENRAAMTHPHDPGARAIVSVGTPLPGMLLRVVNEAGDLCPELLVGEVQLAGAAVTRGYHHLPHLGVDGWMPTGDLAFIAEGDLFIVGRLKDTIIARGNNYHPEDIEPIVRYVPGVHHGHCAVVPEGETDERIAVVVETRRKPGELGALRSEVRGRLVRRLGYADVAVYLVAPRSIPYTSSGKVRRRLVRERLRDGGIVDLERAAPAAALVR